MARESASGEERITAIKNAAGLILGVTENRNWLEVFFEGDLMHTRTVDLPAGKLFDIYVEEIPHKTTVYEHPRMMIFFTGPADLRITGDGAGGVVRDARVVLGGVAPIPWRARKAEEFLRGKKLDEAMATQAGEISVEGAKPLKDNTYKVKMAQDLVHRGLLASI